MQIRFLGLFFVGLFIILIVPVIPQIKAQSEPMQPFSGTLCRSFSQGIVKGKVMPDLGQITYCFSRNKISWADNWSPKSNFTFNLPSVAGVSPSVTTFQNSTMIDYRVSASILTRALSGDIIFTQRGYNYKITIRGTITGSASTFPLAIQFPGGAALSYDGVTRSVRTRHLGFNWGDVTVPAVFSNATKTLTMTVTNAFNIDPIADDGSDTCSAFNGVSCSSSAFSNANPNDILIIQENSVNSCSASIPTSSPSVVWALRKNSGNSCLWYALWTSSGSMTITCKQASSGTMHCRFLGLSGADTNDIFDPNGSLPCVSTGTGTSASCTISTTNSGDEVISQVRLGGTHTNPSTSYPDCDAVTTFDFSFGALSALDADSFGPCIAGTLTNSVFSVTWTTSRNWNMIVDAIAPAPPSGNDEWPYWIFLVIPMSVILLFVINRKRI